MKFTCKDVKVVFCLWTLANPGRNIQTVGGGTSEIEEISVHLRIKYIYVLKIMEESLSTKSMGKKKQK